MIEDACVLLVDDDLGLRTQIGGYLAENGLRVLTAADAAEMDEVLATHSVNLIVLDLNLPGEGGLSICRRLAVRRSPAVIIASAAGEEFDRVLGLEIGADDYLAKPFSPRELLARVRSVLRRGAESAKGARTRQVVYHFAGFIYEPSRRQLRAPSGTNVVLTLGEAGLLGAMLEAPGRILSREELLGAPPKWIAARSTCRSAACVGSSRPTAPPSSSRPAGARAMSLTARCCARDPRL
ncbi:response regulator [Phenylobacterium aquaticum]|nr:response regulator [Phenylobacterium aquaticum]MCI3131099.1 response regulator [Phenylobacterium aquaticum]